MPLCAHGCTSECLPLSCQFVKQCDDEELMEIVLPRLAKVITLWEFLMMKVEKGRPPKLHLADMYHEFEALHKQVKKMCDVQLKPVVGSVDASRDNVQTETVNSNQLQVGSVVLGGLMVCIG